jgi:hypothetical protein
MRSVIGGGEQEKNITFSLKGQKNYCKLHHTFAKVMLNLLLLLLVASYSMYYKP